MTVPTEDVGAQQPENKACSKPENETPADNKDQEAHQSEVELKVESAVVEAKNDSEEKAEDENQEDTRVEQAADANGSAEMDTEENVDADTGDLPTGNADESKAASEPCILKKGFPLTLGPKTFSCVEAATSYFKKLISDWPSDHRMNEYEHLVVGALLHDCHPRAKAKIKSGVVAFKVKQPLNTCPRKCLFLCRADGSEEDFSYLKCLSAVAGYDLLKTVRDGWRGPRNGQQEKKHFQARGRGRGRGRGGRGGRGGRSGKVSKR